MLSFIIAVGPMESTLLNALEFFNECTLLACSYCLFQFTSFVPDIELRNKLGLVFISFVALNIGVNWLAILAKLIYETIRTIRVKCH